MERWVPVGIIEHRIRLGIKKRKQQKVELGKAASLKTGKITLRGAALIDYLDVREKRKHPRVKYKTCHCDNCNTTFGYVCIRCPKCEALI